MTQIKKTLGIAGIIALVTAPAMADIASTDYVQSIVNSIPAPVAATASSAGITKLYTSVGTNTDGTMTQAAIKTALDAKLENRSSAEYALGIGGNASEYQSIAIGMGAEGPAYASGEDSIAIGTMAGATNLGGIAIGRSSYANDVGSIAIGWGSNAYGTYTLAIGGSTEANNAIAIGNEAYINGEGAIQLGSGNNYNANTFQVWNTTLLNADGIVPATALATEIPDDCKVDGQECALVARWNSEQEKFIQSWEVVKVSE